MESLLYLVKVKSETRMPRYLQGLFKPLNPSKYSGDVKNIVYRSSWEMAFMCRLDKDDNVVEWSSEEVVIIYISPVDGKPHRYFMDFKVKYKDGRVFLYEIKPAAKRVPPKQPKRLTKRFLTETKEFGVNMAKWHAASLYATRRGWEFAILSEKELGIGSK